jgi:predicted metalloprotease with PDZ domain
MKLKYSLKIENPSNHIAKVRIDAQKPMDIDALDFFLPSWSPGSYLMREYSKNIRTFTVTNKTGEFLHFDQLEKGVWRIDWSLSDVKNQESEFSVEYEIYCHDLTVRTSHIDESHAFIHGPSVFMGVQGHDMIDPELTVDVHPLWSKLHTGLKDISTSREIFQYSASNYDDFIDCPIEIGCHDSDGFMAFGKEHHVVFYGEQYPHPYNLKEDIKIIVETVGKHFDSIPYESYLFMTHLVKNKFGGLEHKNSTALQYDGRKLKNRKDYINWLALVAHEYFHTWNVKRIRPIELGPFDYTKENYTRMHWLTEGLTSFMDELFVLRSELISLEEYLVMQKQNLVRYFSIPGKKFHSLEDSSFNAWIKLYRPDENSNNSSISYYLKGGLVFSTLHFELSKVGKSINDLLAALWSRYKDNKDVGVTKEEVLCMIEDIGNREIREQFETRLGTTEDIDFETYYKNNGMEFIWQDSGLIDLGVDFEYRGTNVFVAKVTIDGASYRAGLNAGDEIIAVNGIRFSKADAMAIDSIMNIDESYTFTISRLEKLYELPIRTQREALKLKEIAVVDREKALNAFMN